MSAFNISIPGGESKRLKTGGMYCPADILVTAEGGSANVIEEIFTVTSACVNAKQVHDLARSLAPDVTKITIFQYLGDFTAVNNQFIYGVLCESEQFKTSVNPRFVYTRWKDGSVNRPENPNGSYDTILNIGDKIRMVVLL